ncbi:hypothetical protein [Tenacibaculum aestuariivivum]|uniref:hypothetical protein n=1 Tax=Tenacibaculum aestuariivivum TaxID=2006131 RepID=UPI003AB25BC6
MNFKFILIALILFLIPERGLLLDNFKTTPSSNTTENQNNKWAEEEKEETEITSVLFDNETIESGSSSGSNTTAFTKLENNFIFHNYFTLSSTIIKHWVLTSKYPKYIQYCSLKLHC